MTTTQNTKQTYALKKLRTGKLVLALVGAFTVGAAATMTSADAAEWTARTADQIKQDIGDFSKPYTIKWGDTLSAIQEATGVDYHKLAADNGIKDVNMIYAGNALYNKDGYTAVANAQTGEVKVYQSETPVPTSNTQAAVSNAVANTVVKDVTDSKDQKVQEIKQELQQTVQPNVKVNFIQQDAVKPAETVKPVEATKPVQPVQPTKPVENTKPAETVKPAKPVENTKPAETVKPVQPTVTEKGQPEVQPTLPEAVISEKGEALVQPALPEAVVTEKGQPEVQPALPEAVVSEKGEALVQPELPEKHIEEEQPSQPAKPAQPTVSEKGEALVQPELPEAIVSEKGEALVQPELPEAVVSENGEAVTQPELPEAVVETEVVNNVITFGETTQDDPELLEGKTRREEGVNGNEQVIFEIVKENGVVKSRTEISRTVTTAAKNAIVYRGTKKAAPAQPVVTTKVVTETVEKDVADKVIEDDSLATGKTVVESKGTKTRVEQDYEVTYTNGVETSKVAKGEPREIAGTPGVVRKGTGHLLKYNNTTTHVKPADGYTWEALNKVSDAEKSKMTDDVDNLRDIQLEDKNAEEDTKIATNLLNLTTLNNEFLKLINTERAAQGKKPLVVDENLVRLAKIRSDEQAGVGSLRTNGKKHTRPDGTRFASVFNTLKDADMRYGTRGENALEDSSMTGSAVAMLNATELAKGMFEQWKSSPGHYRNMMSDQYTSFGLSSSYAPHSTTTPEYYTGKTMVGITLFANDYDLPVR